MASTKRIGVIFRTLDPAVREQLAYKRLVWAAESGPSVGPVKELDLDDMAAAKAAVDLIKQENLLGLVVVGCPLGGLADRLATVVTAQKIDPISVMTVEATDRTETGYEISAGTRQSLLQSMTVLAGLEEPVYQTMDVSTDVMVYGGGTAAVTAAEELRRAGYGVIMVNPGSEMKPETVVDPETAAQVTAAAQRLAADDGVKMAHEAELVGLTGAAGVFTCRAIGPDGPVEKRVGAAVLAQAPPMKPNLDGLKLKARRRVMTISALKARLAEDGALDGFKPEDDRPMNVGFAVGLGVESNPAQFRAALNAGLALKEKLGAMVSLMTGNAKMAAPDMEAAVEQARAGGVILTKFTRKEIEALAAPQFVRFTYMDEVLNRPVRQEFDLLVVDEVPEMTDDYTRLADLLYLKIGRDGYLQPDQVNALPVLAPRAGVFLAGPSRGPGDVTSWIDDAQAAVLGVRKLLKKGQVIVQADRVTIDKSKCAMCLTCMRVCPEKAIGLVGARPVISPLACTTCGSCASECPQDAIQAVNLTDRRFESEIKAAVKRSESGLEPEAYPEILVFACANSAAKAISKARADGAEWPDGVRLIELPCAGKLDPAFLLLAFNQGFDGVIVLSCFEKACYSFYGSTWAGYRAEHVRVLMAETGLDPARLVKAQLSPSQAADAMSLINQTVARLSKLGPNPLKQAARTGEFLDRFTVNIGSNFVIAPAGTGSTGSEEVKNA